jgi:aldehyde:ferredoxin oxidoreductase
LKGKGKLVQSIQDNRAYVDSLGMCTVVRSAMGFRDEPWGDVLAAVTGYDFTSELMEIGARIYTLERLILNREGIRREDDMLPQRVTDERIPTGPTEGRILTRQMYDEMLDEYYSVRGWDAEGIPLPATLHRLQIEKVVQLAS